MGDRERGRVSGDKVFHDEHKVSHDEHKLSHHEQKVSSDKHKVSHHEHKVSVTGVFIQSPWPPYD